jgi:hypothetical protein
MHAEGDVDHLTILRRSPRDGGLLALDARSASTENPASYRVGRATAAIAVMHEHLLSGAEASVPERGTDKRVFGPARAADVGRGR